MKTKVLTTVMAFFIASSLSAQPFVGGSMNFGTNSKSTTTAGVITKGDSYFDLGLYPTIGLYLSDKMAIGAEIGFSMSGSNDNAPVTPTKESSTLFGIGPFVRFHILEGEKVSMLTQADVNLGFGSSKSITGNQITKGPSVFQFELAIKPGVSYGFSDKISIEAFLGGLSFVNQSASQTVGGVKYSASEAKFKFNFSTVLSFGFIYKL